MKVRGHGGHGQLLPVGGLEEGEEMHSQEGEEARPQKPMPRPDMPSQAEIDRHRIDHLPYRAWCPECVEGFGRERAHRAGTSEERSIPLVSRDYMYLSRRGVLKKEELSEEEQTSAVCVLVAKCGATECLFAHVVLQKGVDGDGYVVDQLKKDILWLGHSKVVIRSDDEPAILRVVERVAQALRASAGVERVH